MGLRGGCIAASHFTQNLPSIPFANISAFGGNKKSSCYYKVGFDSTGGIFFFLWFLSFACFKLSDYGDDMWHSPKETFMLLW